MKLKNIALLGCALLALNAVAAEIPAEWAPGYTAVQRTLYSNLRAPNHSVPFYHVWPSPIYRNIYLWDSSFISLIWLKVNPDVAKDVIRSLIYFEAPNGRISHMVENRSDKWTNPPLIAWAASQIARETGDQDFAEEVYPRLKAFHNWYWSARRLPSGLFFWKHPYESGIDNSQRFGTRDESYFIDTRHLAAVDFSSYAVMDSLALIDLIHMHRNITPELEQDLQLFQEQAQEEQRLIQENLWDEDTGYFYDRFEDTGELSKIPSIMSFFPMLAGAATDHQKQILVEHLRNENEFNTHIPFPTISHADPRFEKDCWRGPVWINTAYLGIQALKEAGENELAAEMARKLVSGVYTTWENTGKIVEFYDPDRDDFTELSRKRGTGLFDFFSASHNPLEILQHLFLKELLLGTKPVAHFVGWTGLVNNLALEYGDGSDTHASR